MQRRLVAEALGTFTMIFAGTGAIIVNSMTNALGHVGVAMTWGLVVMAMIYSFGHVSGAHMNPAVSIAFWIRGNLERRAVLPYIIAQAFGAFLASGLLRYLFGNIAHLGASLPRGTWQQSFVLELLLTMILMLVILGAAVHEKAIKSFAGVAIGATIGLEAMFAGPICGASMNPIRTLAPAIVSGEINDVWIYIISTILGAIIAVGIDRLLKTKEILT